MLPERFEVKTAPCPMSGCVLWIGATTSDGYGQMSVAGKRRGAHVLAWEDTHGPVPTGLQLDHLCRVRCCANPAHLEPVTPRENYLRGDGLPAQNARKATCLRGHALDEANTYRKPGRPAERACRQCRRITQRIRRAAR